MRKYAQQNSKDITAAQQEVIHRLQRYRWPGNVRELENVIERAVVMAGGDTIRVADLPPHLQAIEPDADLPRTFIFPPDATLSDIEQEAIAQALKQHHGNRKAVARRLGIGLATLYRKLNEYQLR